MSQSERYVEVAKTSEITSGKMKHVEVEGKEIVVSNVGGKYYAMDDRCGHMMHYFRWVIFQMITL
ncbi:hypothetical protein BH18THE2_BH18THE2_23930 [soil metagenome]